ncbi:MAG: hypothetical protein R2750_04210 [Bacteroidales bacterium]
MKSIFRLILLVPILIWANLVFTQTIVWEEDFTYSDGTTQGSGIPPKWTIDVSNCTFSNANDYFEVKGNLIEGRDLDGEAVLFTEVIDISAFSSVNLSVSIESTSNMEPTDYVRVYYKLDGGPIEQFFSINGNNSGNIAQTYAEQFSLSGSSVQIICRVLNDGAGERHYIDDILVYSPIPGDDCSDAIVISEITDFPFSTTAATASGQNPGCGGTDPMDIWFSYTPASNGIASVDLCGSLFDTRLAVWDACGGSVLVCNDDDDYCGVGSLQSYLSGPVTAGTTYYIQVGGYDSNVGDGDITISLTTAAVNDNCNNAIPLNEVTDYPFSTLNATSSGQNPGCGGNQDPVDIWFSYTPSLTGIATVDLCGSSFNTRLAVWNSCGGSVLICNDDDDNCGPGSTQSYLTGTVNAGTTYYIQVGGYNTATGTGDITITLDPFPSNNDCANALSINEVTDLPFNTKQATASGAIPDCGGTIAPIDLWYAYTATSTGTALFDLCGSSYITRLALWDGCGGNVLACNEILGPECLLQSSFEYDVTMGTTYYVQVGGWNANVGNGDLSIFVYPFPTNDECIDAIAINEVFDLPFSTKGATAGGDNPGCGGGQDPLDIWFEYTATVTGFASIDLCGSNFNTRLAVWDGCRQCHCLQ